MCECYTADMTSTIPTDIQPVLQYLVSQICSVLGDNVTGIYLFGSLSYGDFNPESSDIDLMVIVHTPLTSQEQGAVQEFHKAFFQTFPQWAKRLECSYTPCAMLSSTLPPTQPRPYLGEGKWYPEADYGNEWIINLYLLQEYGVTLYGPDFNTLIPHIDITSVQAANIRDLHQEWEPKLTDPAWLDNSHYQSYLVLNLCRILNIHINSVARSKKKSAAWVKQHYPKWQSLITEAERWKYGTEMHRQSETLEFLQFVLHIVR